MATNLRQRRTAEHAKKKATRRTLNPEQLMDMCADASEQREVRNGFTEAMTLLHITLPKAFAKTDGPTEAEVRTRLVNEHYGPMLDDHEFTEAFFDNAKQEIFDSGGCVDIVEEAIAYCVFAVRSYFEGNDDLSWSYACDARHWGGIVTMIAKRGQIPKPGQLLAKIRHQQTYKEHDTVADYWHAKIDPTLSAQRAADAIVQAGVTTFSHKKIAEIVSALRKAERSRKK